MEVFDTLEGFKSNIWDEPGHNEFIHSSISSGNSDLDFDDVDINFSGNYDMGSDESTENAEDHCYSHINSILKLSTKLEDFSKDLDSEIYTDALQILPDKIISIQSLNTDNNILNINDFLTTNNTPHFNSNSTTFTSSPISSKSNNDQIPINIPKTLTLTRSDFVHKLYKASKNDKNPGLVFNKPHSPIYNKKFKPNETIGFKKISNNDSNGSVIIKAEKENGIAGDVLADFVNRDKLHNFALINENFTKVNFKPGSTGEDSINTDCEDMMDDSSRDIYSSVIHSGLELGGHIMKHPQQNQHVSEWRSVLSDREHHQILLSRYISQQPKINGNIVTGPLLLTEEEKRTLIAEGYPVPKRYPLTKMEEKSLKKIRRKIKNKISAQESRRKKKEYIEALENKVQAYATDNNILKNKVKNLETNNLSLQSQLKKLTNLATSLYKSVSTQTNPSSCFVILFSFLVAAGLNIFPLKETENNEAGVDTNNQQYQTINQQSRVLHWESCDNNYKYFIPTTQSMSDSSTNEVVEDESVPLSKAFSDFMGRLTSSKKDEGFNLLSHDSSVLNKIANLMRSGPDLGKSKKSEMDYNLEGIVNDCTMMEGVDYSHEVIISDDHGNINDQNLSIGSVHEDINQEYFIDKTNFVAGEEFNEEQIYHYDSDSLNSEMNLNGDHNISILSSQFTEMPNNLRGLDIVANSMDH
ncbi:unnamed protein product [Gordionus sp. m RMFG-2023]|uniref:uncharacterized protein LOC135925958 n=1 Tax=Gordionus sp. m RMFG-2023 TaxID=3053472 RepID=UPI0030DFDB17